MREIVLDVETTISNKGNPFDQTNKLCYVGIKGERFSDLFDIEYSVYPYVPELEKIQLLIDQSDILIGFNIKFDLHWIRRYGINFSNKRIWD
jgi:DNA polymerase III epsilon subunit-like protein